MPVTGEAIQAWAGEAERGYPVDQLRKRGRRTVGEGPAEVVPVRMHAALLQELTTRTEHDHLSRPGSDQRTRPGGDQRRIV